MTTYQPRYPSLRVTVKHETDKRSVKAIDSNSRSYHHPTTVFYNRNLQQKRYFHRPSTSQKYHRLPDHHHQQPIRPLMEIPDPQYSIPDHDLSYSYIVKQRRVQYHHRKVELDWDHAFDLDQIDLYPVQNDIDVESLISSNSSTDNSFSSV